MKFHRSLRRRSFSVGTAGWFTVLRPDESSAVPRMWRTPCSSSLQTSQEASTPTLAVQENVCDHLSFRTSWIVLAASAITAGLLWWIMHP